MPSPLAVLEGEIQQVASQINTLLTERKTKAGDVEQLSQAKQAIDRELRAIAGLEAAHKDALLRAGIEFDEVLKIAVDTAKLDKTITDLSSRLAEEKRGLTKFYDSVKKAIDGEIAKHGDDLGDYAISIQAGLSFEPRFYGDLLAFVNQNAKGTDWESDLQILAFVQDVVAALHSDKRTDLKDGDRARSVADQLRDRKTPTQLYDYLFGFDHLRPKYELKVDGKDLSASCRPANVAACCWFSI